MMDTELSYSHSQLAVFEQDVPHPFNDWSDAHVSQGFSWRPESVSFRTLDESGRIRIRATREPVAYPSAGSRILVVPFEARTGFVEIASIEQSAFFRLAPGHYALTFEHGETQGEMWATLHFTAADGPVEPAILRGVGLQVPTAFLMRARPA